MAGCWRRAAGMPGQASGVLIVCAILNTVPARADRDQTDGRFEAWLASEEAVPVAIYRLFPRYTPAPGAGFARGAVEIEAVVDAAGRVAHARVLTSLAETFDRASLEALRRWRFRPAQRSGRPVATLIGVRFVFLPPRAAGQMPEVSGMTGLLPRQPLPVRRATPDALAPDGTPGFVPPRAIRAIMPEYTAPARGRRIEGDVEVEAVVLADGTVGSARVVRSLDRVFGLDEQALISARYWLFEPASLDGRPVPALTRLVVTFTLN